MNNLCYYSRMFLHWLVLIIATMRPKQWLKNGFLFTALIFDRQLTHIPAFLHTLAGFGLFCLLSGAVYIINDIVDVEADRKHPTKRERPIAAGTLPIPLARWALILILAFAIPASFLLSPVFAIFAISYFLLNLAYSLWFKHIPILDIIVLASFYVVRVGAGVVLIVVALFSPWLYVFTTFLALFLGIGKRRAELALLADDANSHRKVLEGYTLPLLDQFIIIVSASTILTYSLYTFSAQNLPPDHVMMLTIPFVIYGIFRYLYLIQVEHSGGAPEEVLLSDRPLQLSIILWGLSILVIFYLV